MSHVFVEHQPSDKTYAVYIGGDGDVNGSYDQLFSYGVEHDGRVVRRGDARAAAVAEGRRLAHKFNDGFTVLE